MNIYKILETLKNVEESEERVYRIVWQDSEGEVGSTKLRARSSTEASERFKNECDPELDILEIQSSMFTKEDGDYPFAGKAVGQKAGDQVRGKEKATKSKDHPFKGRLVGAAESIERDRATKMSSLEQKLRARWEQTKQGLAEYGMTTGGTAGAATKPDPAALAKDLTTAQQNLSKLKSAGVNLSAGVSQAAKSAVGAVNEPEKIPTQQDKQISMGLGGELEQVLTKADPGQVQQVANVLKQVKQGQ